MVKATSQELRRCISHIMRKVDLSAVSAKKIRALCEKKFKVDMSSRKKEIDQIIMEFIQREDRRREKERNKESDLVSSSGSSISDSDSDESCESGGSSDSRSCSSECSSSFSGSGSSPNEEKSARVLKKSAKGSKNKRLSDSYKHQNVSADVENKLPKKEKVPVQPHEPAKFMSPKMRLKKENNMNQAAKAQKSPVKMPKKSVKKEKDLQQAGKSSKMPARMPKKVVKKENTEQELNDAAIARRLQAEQWNFRASTVKRAPRDMTKRKEEKNGKPKSGKATACKKKCVLSPELAEVMQTAEMARADVVKKVWDIVKQRDLFDPTNKRFAICDEQLFHVFRKNRFRLFGMMKYLKNHIKDKN